MTTTPRTDLGERIRSARRRRRLTQARAAEAAGMLQSTWSDIETGRVSPTVQTLRRIADALGVRPGRLVD